jgi:hypothetical protein
LALIEHLGYLLQSFCCHVYKKEHDSYVA